jgi:glycosyltransferase involved in cell wall biosynthesis
MTGMRFVDGMPSLTPVAPARDTHVYAPHMRVLHGEVTPLLPPIPGMSEAERLRIAIVIPQFQFGSGGHSVLFQVISRLERRGHVCSIWLEDPFGFHERPIELVRDAVRADYAGVEAPFFHGFHDWMGADVVMATGWQTAYPVMGLDGCRARVYMVNDHEPEFYPTSIETHLAAATYRLGLPCLAGGGDWMARTLTERYGARVLDVVPYGIDEEYRPRPVERRTDTVVLYAREITPRRAVALGLMALEHVHRRRPGLRVVVFGDPTPPEAAFPYEHIGLASPGQLAWLYSEATVGVAFSMTNASLVPQDMLACGLPVVDVAGYGTEAVHGRDGAAELAPFDDVAVAAAIERLLDDPGLRAERRRAGLEHASRHTWDRTTDRVEAGLRTALRERTCSGS